VARKRNSESGGAASRGDSATVVRRLLELIHQRELRVGDQLPNIRQLAEMLDVKPTAVRDALLQAQTMGLLRILPRSGAFIQSLTYAPLVEALTNTLEPALIQTDHNLFHLLDARRLLEVELVGRAAEHRKLEELLPVRQALEAMARIPEAERRNEYVEADVRFHTEIARLAGNSVLLTIQQALLGLLKPHLAQLPWSPQRRQKTDRSHAEIYSALVKGHANDARAAMAEHLGMAYQSLLQTVRSLPKGHEDRTAV
jgi:GntR family transcriptional regulator, transcriptional repressor for pyruvate dehydrogenase complex